MNDLLIKKLLCFAYGVGSLYRIEQAQNIYVSEIISLLMLLMITLSGQLRMDRDSLKISLGYTLVLLSLIFSDYMNSSTAINSAKGWGNMIFAQINFLFLYSISRRNPNIIPYLFLGLLTGSALSIGSFSGGSFDNYLKTYFAPLVFNLLIFLALAKIYWGVLNSVRFEIVFVVSGVIMLFLGMRSSGMLLVVGVFLIPLLRRIKFADLLGKGGFLVAVLYVGYAGYVYSITDTSSDHIQNQLARISNPYNPIEFLIAGRTEVLVALEAIADGPAYGRGSWAVDSDGYYSSMISELQGQNTIVEKAFIVAHSTVVTSWLWAGYGGLLGMLLVLWIAVSRAVVALKARTEAQWVLGIFLAYFLWHMAFSPIGHVRTTFPILISYFLILYHKNRQRVIG